MPPIAGTVPGAVPPGAVPAGQGRWSHTVTSRHRSRSTAPVSAPATPGISPWKPRRNSGSESGRNRSVRRRFHPAPEDAGSRRLPSQAAIVHQPEGRRICPPAGWPARSIEEAHRVNAIDRCLHEHVRRLTDDGRIHGGQISIRIQFGMLEMVSGNVGDDFRDWRCTAPKNTLSRTLMPSTTSRPTSLKTARVSEED